MMELCKFATVEDFWRNFAHCPRPSEVFFDGDCRKKVGPEQKTVEEYSLFKAGIEPEWGDPANVTGGEWFCRQFFDGDVLDLYWQNLVLAVIGESIEDSCDVNRTYSDHINGVRVLDKSRGYPLYKMEIWLSTRDASIRNRIKTRLLEVITDGQPSHIKTVPKFEWKDHSS
jgi:translation initiation factor 4E